MNRIQLVQLKHAIKLESLGMKHSSGKSANAFACKLLGLPRGTKKEITLQRIQEVLAQ